MFDYSKIPYGHYDKVLDANGGMRKFWHHHKFDSVSRTIHEESYKCLLDIGCFAGSFIGRYCPNENMHYGVDILNNQIKYANEYYSNEHKKFYAIEDLTDITNLKNITKVDVVTFIEVIEHLTNEEIEKFCKAINDKLSPSGRLILTTPNYFSIWPLLEYLLNKFSDVDYTEQHINKFNYFNIEKRLQKIYPSFYDEYEIIYKTTTHFLSPFLAIFNYKFAEYFSRKIKGKSWGFPFGLMILINLRKK